LHKQLQISERAQRDDRSCRDDLGVWNSAPSNVKRGRANVDELCISLRFTCSVDFGWVQM